MKNKLFLGAAALALMLSFSSCASSSQTGIIAPFAYTEVKPNEIRAELDVSENNRVEAKVRQWYVAGIRVSGGRGYYEDKSERRSMFGKRANKAQSCAMLQAVEQGNYDMIVNPHSTRTSFISGSSVSSAATTSRSPAMAPASRSSTNTMNPHHIKPFSNRH